MTPYRREIKYCWVEYCAFKEMDQEVTAGFASKDNYKISLENSEVY